MPDDYVSIRPLLVDLIDAGLDPESAADRVLIELDCETLRRLIRPALVWIAKNAARANTRAQEEEVDHRIEAGEDPVSARRKLSEDGFYPARGEPWVSWLDATVEQHQARIDWQTTLTSAIQRDIARHRKAIEDIIAAGVTCLRDLGAAA